MFKSRFCYCAAAVVAAPSRRPIVASSRTRSAEFAFALGRRWQSSSAPADATLPLKGYRVLDLTRVLAGVSLCHST